MNSFPKKNCENSFERNGILISCLLMRRERELQLLKSFEIEIILKNFRNNTSRSNSRFSNKNYFQEKIKKKEKRIFASPILLKNDLVRLKQVDIFKAILHIYVY